MSLDQRNEGERYYSHGNEWHSYEELCESLKRSVLQTFSVARVTSRRTKDTLTRFHVVFDADGTLIPATDGDERIEAFVSLKLVHDSPKLLVKKVFRLIKQGRTCAMFDGEYVSLKPKLVPFAIHLKVSTLPWTKYDPSVVLGSAFTSL